MSRSRSATSTRRSRSGARSSPSWSCAATRPGWPSSTLGDQFLALAEGRSAPPDAERHFGLVVDDKQATLAAAREAGATPASASTFVDPWGNNVQVVEYADVQFTKTREVLHAMGLDDLQKSERALAELRAKGVEG